MKKKRMVALALALWMVLALLAGCQSGGQSGNQGGSQGGNTSTNSQGAAGESGDGNTAVAQTLNLVFSDDIDTLNPHMERSSTDAEVIWSVGGVLYRITPGADTPYQIVPEYAAGAPEMVDGEGLVWRIAVREDAKWADGTAMTAEDFVYSLKMLYDPLLLNAPGTTLDEYGVCIVNAEAYMTQASEGVTVAWEDVGVKAVDGNAFELTLEKAASASQVELAFSSCITVPVRQDLYEAGMSADKSETNYGSSWDKFASSGPFTITGWTKDAEITMEANPNYPLKDDITLTSITYKIVPESGTRLQLFESGQIDMVALSEADLEKYGEDPRVLEVPGGGVLCIGIDMINTNNPILQNQKFRQALFFGTNRVEACKLGNNIPADYFITQPYILDIDTGLAYRDTEVANSYIDTETYSYDPDLAKQLFDEALQEVGVDKASLEILYQDSSESRKKVCEYLQNAWQELFGADQFTVTLQAVPSKQLSERYRSHTSDPNAFESGVIQSTYNYLDPASALMEWNMNATRKKIPYYDEEFTAFYDAAVALPLADVDARAEKIAQAETVMLEDAPFVPVMQTVQSVLISERVVLPYTTYNSVLRYAWPWAQIQ